MKQTAVILIILTISISSSVQVLAQAPPPAQPNSSPPLSVSDIEHGLKAGVTNTRMAVLVKQYGVDFELTDVVEKQLRGTGANTDLLLAISRGKRSSGTSEKSHSAEPIPPNPPAMTQTPASSQRPVQPNPPASAQPVPSPQEPAQAHPASPAQAGLAALPTKEEVNSFLRETFGYDPSTSWKIVSISPSEASGFTEVKILLTNAQGQQPSTFYVSADGEHALAGSIMPFGKGPYKSRPDVGVAFLPTEEDVNSFLHDKFGSNPSLSWKFSILPSEIAGVAEVRVVMTNAKGQMMAPFYVSADGEHALVGNIIPFGERPYDAAAYELQKAIDGPSIGSSDAPVTVVEFADFQCPTCKELQATVQKLVSQPNVRLVFQNFPLPSHDWAWRAAVFADCIAHESNDAFWRFASNVYTEQSSISINNVDQRLSGIATASGVHLTKIQACLTSAETDGRVQHSIKLGTSLHVEQLPTLFIGGRKVAIKSVPYSILEELVTHALGDPPGKLPYQSGASPDPTASNAAASTSHTQSAPTIASNDAVTGSGVDAHDCITRGVTMPGPGEGNWPVVALQNRCSKAVIVRFAGFAGAETGDEWTVDFRVEIDSGKSTTHMKMDEYKFDCLQGQSPNVYPEPSCSGWQIVWTASYKDSNQEPPRPNVPRRTKVESVR